MSSSTLEPPVTITGTQANKFRSTFVYGVFNNLDNTSTKTQARAAFSRDVLVGGNLFLGNMTVDASDKFLDSTSNIQYTFNKEIVNFPVTLLRFIKNITSDVQQQIIDLSNNITNNGQSSTFTNLTVSGSINGLKIKDYGNGNTSFSSGNTDILGSSNTRVGYFTGSLSGYSNAVFGDQSLQNCTGNSNTAIGHNSQNGNTSYNYNTSLGSNSNIIGGSSNIAIGHVAQCSNCSNSIVIGNSITCSTDNQILLGSSSHTVQIPGNINILGKISQNIGNQNTAFGSLSFSSNTSGTFNSVFGYNSLNSNVSGSYNTAVGDYSLLSSKGEYNTAIGHFSQLTTNNGNQNTSIGAGSGANILNGSYNVCVGQSADISNANYSTAIGYNTNCGNYSNSTAIGYNAQCTAAHQIMVGTSAENVVIPGNLTFNQSINNISSSIFGYLSGLTSNIQSQINSSNSNISTVEYRTRDISFTAGQLNTTTISTYCNTSYLSFSQSLNNISTTTFSYLNGLTSNIQDQINALKNSTPAGTVIAFAGTSTTLPGYKLCDGSLYNAQYDGSAFVNLFNAIGYTYGGNPDNGNFRVPNYKGMFLRCTGSQTVQGKTYTAPALGTTLNDQSTSFSTSNYVDNINTQVRSVVTGGSNNIGTFTYSNAISSLNFTTANNSFNNGNNETFPVHMSVQYFIKY